MPQGLDHIVHAVRDLDAAADFYVRAGFMVGTRNRHPWGTHNRVVQLKNCYIELLEVADPEKIVPHGPRSFSFGAFNRNYLIAREGLSMLLLNSRDALADARAFEEVGISNYEVFDFAREGKKPDGTVVKLAFTLVFTRDPASPDLQLALCQHHFPENFWNAAFQNHANDAQRIAGVVMVAIEPASHREFLKAYSGAVETVSRSGGMIVPTVNGDIELIASATSQDRLGCPVRAASDGMTMNAIRFVVTDLAQTEALHRQNGVTVQRQGERLIVPPEEAFGATLIFEAPEVG